jgi:hypothetical protein
MSKEQNRKTNNGKEKYKQSETVVIKRSQIHFAPYNPKQHSKEQVEEIKRNIKRVAFLGGIVWNKTTGNLIDGHKRIMALDVIHGYDGKSDKDYEIKVEQVALDVKTEKEQNIFQTKSRSDLSNELLADLLRSGIDVNHAGLTMEDVRLIELEIPDFDFGKNSEAENDFTAIRQEQQVRKNAAADTRQEVEKHQALAWQQNIEKIKAAKQSTKDKTEGGRFLTLTFKSFEAKAEFLECLGFDQYEEYLPGEQVDEKIQDLIECGK